MTSRTHDLAAFTALNLVIISSPFVDLSLSTAFVSLGACFLGGLAPDLDKPTSGFWDKIPAGSILGKIIHPFLGGHRLISHSLLGLFIFGWLSQYFLNLISQTLLVNMQIVWNAFMIGYLSHLIADSFTVSGVKLLYPFKRNYSGFIKTGTRRETSVLIIFLVLDLFLLYRFL